MMEQTELRDEIMDRLGNVVCPCASAQGYSSYGIDDMGLVKSIEMEDDEVVIDLRVTNPACLKIGYLEDEINKYVGKLSEVESISITVDDGLEWRPQMMSEEFQKEREKRVQKIANKE